MFAKKSIFFLFLLIIPLVVYSQSDTNWQTSWSIFDSNIKSHYQLTNNNSLHWHDFRYYTQTQSDTNWGKYIPLNANINWNRLQNYPAPCQNGQVVQDINDTAFVCTAAGGSSGDTNWQTSWTELDANLKATYPIKSDVNNWGDQRYTQIGSTSIIKVKTTDQSSGSLISITGLEINLLANKKYGFHCRIINSANNSNNGQRFGMLTPLSPTSFSAKIVGWTSTTAITITNVTASDSLQPITTSQGSTNAVYEIMGSIHNVNAGTLVPRFNTETGASSTIRAGSWCLYTQGV